MKKQKLRRIMNSYLFDVHNDNPVVRIWILMIYCVLFILLESILYRIKVSYIQGIVGQLLLIMSIYIVTRIPKIGFRVVVGFNLVQLSTILLAYLRLRQEDILPGIFVTSSTLIVAWIIHRFHTKLSDKYYEIQEQKNAYMMIYENLARNEQKLESLTLIDNTTSVGNRKMVMDFIDKAKEDPLTSEFTVVLIDLDDFKLINDHYGHQYGDHLLLEIATKLKGVIGTRDILARFGGDEFAIVIRDQRADEELLAYLESLKEQIEVNSSFGVTRYPKDTMNFDKILKFAETALSKAKNKGKDQIVFFNEEMEVELREKSLFEERLFASIQQKELFLMYQPQFASHPKRIRGFEALSRWNSVQYGVVSPKDFISIAERTGFIHQMGEWVLRNSCKKLKELMATFSVEHLVMSVNISPVQIREPYFVGMVKNIMKETGVLGANLEFEITESIFLEQTESLFSTFQILRGMGIKIALDDFGTGYSSLNYLQRLPIDTLKIDKSFIDQIDGRGEKRSMTGHMVKLAHDLNLKVIAEGVELQTQLDYLIDAKCDYIQGFIWGKPQNEIDMLQYFR